MEPRDRDPRLKPWKVLRTDKIFKAETRLSVSVDTVELPDGRIIDDYYQVSLPDFAIAVPVLENGRILTLWQYKHGVRRESLTFPAGQIEDGENPESAIRRELLEETGYEAKESMYLKSFVISGNQRCNEVHMFNLTGCRKVAEPNDSDLEESILRELSIGEVQEHYQMGNIPILPQAAVWLAFRATNFS